jgi:glycosyltransferase involved in cell wall biosynthesis
VTHDAVSVLHPELFPLSVRLLYNPLYGWSARNATLVITDSEAARQDIALCWRVPLSRIRVVYLAPAEIFGPEPASSRLEDIRKRYTGSAPYFLFVGKLSGRRNIPRLLEGFAEFKRRTSRPHKLLLIGLNIRGLDVTGLVAKLGLSGEVIHSLYVPDADLNLIYNAAKVFVSPSTYETVSLPVLEAQATGTPVICIDTAGMREITGGAALFIPKLEGPEIAHAMSRLTEDESLRRNLSQQGLLNAKRFSWQRCSRETLAILAEAAHMHRK